MRQIRAVGYATAIKYATNTIVSMMVGYDWLTGMRAAESAAPDCVALGIGGSWQLSKKYSLGLAGALEVAIGLETGNAALYGAGAATTGGSGWGPYFGFSWNTPTSYSYKGLFRSMTLTLGRLPQRIRDFVRGKVQEFLPRLHSAFATRNGPIGNMAREISPRFAGKLSGAIARMSSVVLDANYSITLWGGFGISAETFSDAFGFSINLEQSGGSIVGSVLGSWSVSTGRYWQFLPRGEDVLY